MLAQSLPASFVMCVWGWLSVAIVSKSFQFWFRVGSKSTEEEPNHMDDDTGKTETQENNTKFL